MPPQRIAEARAVWIGIGIGVGSSTPHEDGWQKIEAGLGLGGSNVYLALFTHVTASRSGSDLRRRVCERTVAYTRAYVQRCGPWSERE